VLERGNTEFNGLDTIILNWDCQKDRNSYWTKEETENLFREHFNVSKVIWTEGYEADDITKGHIDGVARFVNKTTVAVARYVDQRDKNAWIYENAASTIKEAGFNVVRIDVPGKVSYKGI